MISVTILTKNSKRHLGKVLDSVKSFDEVIVYDTGSTDETVAIASRYSNVKIHLGPFEGFGKTHNIASSLAKNDWILSVDSDEVVSPELLREIQNLQLKPQEVYSLPRNNYYNGKWIRWCGWYPDRVVRLYNRKKTRFSDAEVHEAVIVDGLSNVNLRSPLIHFPYETTADFLTKMQIYSELFAKQNAGRKRSSFLKALARGGYTFFKCYFLQRGFLGGPEGYIISRYNANTAFYKYLKLKELNHQIDK